MGKVLTIVGVVAILLGGLWIGQGSNLIKGSSMTGQTMWLVIGIIVLLAGVLLIVASLDRRRRAGESARGRR